MHELVIVLSDFYVSQEAPDRELPAGVTLSGVQQAARFGTRVRVPGGWRPWLSRWLNEAAGDAPATVAAAATDAALQAGALAWVATPMYLVAGLTSIHVDRRSILRLDASDQAALVADFQRVFHDSGFFLQSLDAGDFLMLGPQLPVGETLEPSRFLGASMADAKRGEAQAPKLLRLGAEIEMWLHDHAVNDVRRRRGEPPVTTLWLWGGGRIADDVGVARGDGDGDPAQNIGAMNGARSAVAHGDAAPGPMRDASAARESTARDHADAAASADIAFGRDSYLQGLWAARAAKVFPLPQQLADVFSYPQAQRAVLLIEIGLMLQPNPTWTFFDAVAHIDRSFVVPAIEALNRGRFERLVILANDQQLTLRARDRLKIWRRTPPGLSGLQ